MTLPSLLTGILAARVCKKQTFFFQPSRVLERSSNTASGNVVPEGAIDEAAEASGLAIRPCARRLPRSPETSREKNAYAGKQAAELLECAQTQAVQYRKRRKI